MTFGKLITAMITPFTESDQVNYAEAVKIANYLAETGSDTILLAGTTGESPTLTHEEELTLFKEVKNGLNGKAKVMAGTGSNCTKTAIKMTNKAEELGVDSCLIVVPYYNKPPQEALFQHFKTVAENTALPLMIYNIPGRTSRNMEPETVARLAEIKNYTAIKEAAGDLAQLKKIRELTDPAFKIYAGDDALTYEALKLGATGVVSVAAHLVGTKIKELIEVFEQDQPKAAAIQQELQELFEVLFITTNPMPIKEAMNLLGYQCGQPRLPLIALNQKEKEILKEVLIKYQLL